jgi:hypothetical protein
MRFDHHFSSEIIFTQPMHDQRCSTRSEDLVQCCFGQRLSSVLEAYKWALERFEKVGTRPASQLSMVLSWVGFARHDACSRVQWGGVQRIQGRYFIPKYFTECD